MTHDYTKALEWIDDIYDFRFLEDMRVNVGINEKKLHDYICRHSKVIRHALKFAEKMSGEPSYAMRDAGSLEYYRSAYINDVFKAMRDQALKEIEG